MRKLLVLTSLVMSGSALAQSEPTIGLRETARGWTVDTSRVAADGVWIANTGEGSISLFDATTQEERGRYLTGPLGAGNDPSRCSVDSLGDVFVANRRGVRVTHIAAGHCPDRDGDGSIWSSRGGLLPWGSDECVRWSTDLAPVMPGETRLRAIAVQDGAPGDPSRRVVWAGGYESKRIAQLDAETGEILGVTDAPVRPYGFALAPDGQLWIATREGERVGRIDTLRCTTESCAVCHGAGVGDACAAQILDAPVVPYGVAVDARGRVWFSGTDLARYNPRGLPGARWELSHLPWSGSVVAHGIAAAPDGSIWAAAMEHGILRVDAEQPSRYSILDGSAGLANKGIGVDRAGRAWSIMLTGRVDIWQPTVDLGATVDADAVDGLVAPYTYSDMTGAQLQLATGARGVFRRSAEAGCDSGFATGWRIESMADVPAGTEVNIRARTQPEAGWRRVDLGVEVLSLRSEALQVEAWLQADGERSPTLRSLIVSPVCSRMDVDAGMPPAATDAGMPPSVDAAAPPTRDGGSFFFPDAGAPFEADAGAADLADAAMISGGRRVPGEAHDATTAPQDNGGPARGGDAGQGAASRSDAEAFTLWNGDDAGSGVTVRGSRGCSALPGASGSALWVLFALWARRRMGR